MMFPLQPTCTADFQQTMFTDCMVESFHSLLTALALRHCKGGCSAKGWCIGEQWNDTKSVVLYDCGSIMGRLHI